MSETIIKVDSVSKKFSHSLSHVMKYGVIDVGKSFLGLRSHSKQLRLGEFWAINGIGFEVERGETLGIIGPNGSGKSTLLKMLNGIFMPDQGRIEIQGRVSALIEVGAGFHPMLTGRENIYLNGSIIGMTKKEIDERLKEIIDFAGIGSFIDAPVKHYSSGMYVRLGFSIAIHCEADVLLVDEILSVGDTQFQKKCSDVINQMKSKMAVILVSHNLRHISRICDRCIFLEEGKIKKVGLAHEVISDYFNTTIASNIEGTEILVFEVIDGLEFKGVCFNGSENGTSRAGKFGEPFTVQVDFISKEMFKDVLCSISVVSPEGSIITVINNENNYFSLRPGGNQINCFMEELRLTPGVYLMRIKLISKSGFIIGEAELGSFTVYDTPGVLRPSLGFYREKAELSNSYFN